MPPPPPKPPGPPPPPGPASARATAPVQRPSAPSVDRSAVLQDIQKGARLKKVDRSQIRDRSSPLVASGGGTGVSAALPAPGNESLHSRQNNSRVENGGTALPVAPQAMLGGLFAGGMPTLKKTGFRQYEKESSEEEARGRPVPNKPSRPNPPEKPESAPKPKPFQQATLSPPGPPPSTNGSGDHRQNGHLSPVAQPKAAPPKPAKLQVSPPNPPRPSSLTEIDSNGQNGPPIISPKPAPTPKPPVFSNNHGPHIVSGSATVSAHRPQERKPITNLTMPPQRPKGPPPPLPTNPPPTRNISQTMPRQKQQRPSLPNERMTNSQDSPPTPPPLPGRPPSFRGVNGDNRFKNQPPPPPPPQNSSSGNLGNQFERELSRGLANQVHQQQRPPPPTRPPVMAPSGSMQSLPDSNNNSGTVRPPKRHDSLTTVAPEPPVTNNFRSVPKQAPSPPQHNSSRPPSSPRSSSINMMQEFESKFLFHGLNELPRPSSFSGGRKTYPSAKSRNLRPTAPAPPVNVPAR